MMRILSADTMARIPKPAIKKLVKKYFEANITESGVEEMAAILEEEAKKMANFAVNNAKKNKRATVTKKDIQEYIYSKEN